jgi:pimeloyl-ACP methyl ester carboxylesterase
MNASPVYRTPAGEQAVRAWYESVLAQWPVAHTRVTLPTRQGDTFAVVSGEAGAPPLVLLHGAGSNSASWAGDAAVYSRGHQVAAVDLIGEPGYSAPTRPAYGGPAYAEWLGDVLDGLGFESAVFVGMSLGGWAALKFATTHPERVRALALIAPSGLAPVRTGFMLRLVALSLLGEWGQARLNRMLFAGAPVAPEVARAMRLIGQNFRSRVEAPPIFGADELRRLTMPVMLIVGEKDGFCEAEASAARLGAAAPQARIEIVAGAGHVVLGTAERVEAWGKNPRREHLPRMHVPGLHEEVHELTQRNGGEGAAGEATQAVTARPGPPLI